MNLSNRYRGFSMDASSKSIPNCHPVTPLRLECAHLEAHLYLVAKHVVEPLGNQPGELVLQPLLGEIARHRDHYDVVALQRGYGSIPEPRLEARPRHLHLKLTQCGLPYLLGIH